MIKQNDKNCLPIVQSIGCFLRSCGAIAEIKEMKKLTAEQINELWEWAKKTNNIDFKNCVKHSAPIATQALRMLGNTNGNFIEVATFKKGVLKYYPSITENLKRSKKSYIQKIKTDSTIGTHFRVVDNCGELLFDPYSPTVKVESIFYSIVYSYVEV